MSLSFGLWTVIADGPFGKIICRCTCGAFLEVELALLESSACGVCGHQPLVTQHQDEQRAEQAQQLTFNFGGGQS